MTIPLLHRVIRPLALVAAALAGCSADLTVTFDDRAGDGAAVRDGVERLLESFKLDARSVRQSEDTIEVTLGKESTRQDLRRVRTALQRIIDAELPTTQAPLTIRRRDSDDADGVILDFRRSNGGVALLQRRQLYRAWQLCAYSVVLPEPAGSLRLPLGIMAEAGEISYDEATAHPERVGLDRRYSLMLGEVAYESGADELHFEGVRAHFVFNVVSDGAPPPPGLTAPAGLVVSRRSFADCAHRVFADASDDFIGRVMFPNLTKLVIKAQ